MSAATRHPRLEELELFMSSVLKRRGRSDDYKMGAMFEWLGVGDVEKGNIGERRSIEDGAA